MNLGVSYKFSALSKLLKPLKVSLNHDLELERICIDSRKVFVGSSALFIALKGTIGMHMIFGRRHMIRVYGLF